LTDPAPILPYDEVVTANELIIRRAPQFLRVSIPNVTRLRDIGIGYVAIVGYFSLIVLAQLNSAWRRADFWDIGPPLVMMLALCSVVLLFAWMRWQTRFVLEVTRDALTIRRVVGLRERAAVSYRRDLVHSIRKMAGSHKLAISITGHDLQEIGPMSHRVDLGEVAGVLMEAIKDDPESIDRAQPEILTPADLRAIDGTRNTILYGWMVGAGVTATVVASVSHWGIGLLVFFVLLIPVGIIMGTQQKDFWL